MSDRAVMEREAVRVPGPFRVLAGDFISLTSWGSIATRVDAFVTLTPDHGPDINLGPFSHTTSADRTAVVTDHARIQQDGYITALNATAALGTKRGSVLILVGVVGPKATRERLCSGYVYESHNLTLGEFVEAGPGHGNGSLRDLAVASTEVPAAGLANAVPANAIWKVHMWRFVYTATAAVGTRTLRVQIRSPGGDVKWSMDDDVSITASQVAVIQLARTWGDTYQTSSIPGANSSRHQLIPFDLLPAGWDIFLDDAADIDPTAPADTLTVEALVEEWIAPGGAVA